MQNVKSRLWNVLLYPDDPTMVTALEYIRMNLDFVGILHDKDVDDNGQIKKSHYHVILKFPQARYVSAIAKELGIKENYFEKTGSWNRSAVYLLHLNDDAKYQYDEKELFGTLVPGVLKLIHQKQEEGERVCDLIALLESIDSVITYTSAVQLACKNGLYSEFRRLGYGMRFILEEHNASVKLKEDL